jgi:probable HAF family extracellular repeat protein
MKRNASRTKSFRITLLGPALAVLAAPVWAQGQKPASARYNVTDLGTLGGSFSLAYGINNRGRIDGFSTLPGDSSVHSFVLENGVMIDLGTLGGPDSQSFAGLNEATQVAGFAETPTPDPNGEDFCGLGTNLVCLVFLWQNGVMTRARGKALQMLAYIFSRVPAPPRRAHFSPRVLAAPLRLRWLAAYWPPGRLCGFSRRGKPAHAWRTVRCLVRGLPEQLSISGHSSSQVENQDNG